jgi:hypothetical protein
VRSRAGIVCMTLCLYSFFWAWYEFFTNFIQRVSICPVKINKTIDEMKPSSHLYSVLRHIAFWLLWFGIQSYTLFSSDLSKYGTIDWLYQVFNYTAPLIVFYAVAYFMVHLLYGGYWGDYVVLNDFSDFRQIVNVESVSIVMITVLYVIVGAFFDINYQGYKYPGNDAFFYERVEVVLPYLAMAACYAIYRINKRNWKEKLSGDSKEGIKQEIS